MNDSNNCRRIISMAKTVNMEPIIVKKLILTNCVLYISLPL